MIPRILIPCFAVVLAYAFPAVAQERFDTPDSAAAALVDAASHHDSARLALILGPHAKAILTSGNPSQDQSEQSEFARLFKAKHVLKPDPRDPARVLVSIGDEDWPFPVPIVQKNGKWEFNPDETLVEMEARRIGTHELDAIEICTGYVEAQRKYASEYRDKNGTLTYASRLMSTPGLHDGLYWEGAGESPLVPRNFADAEWGGEEGHPKPYHGYYFRVLAAQGADAPGGAHDYRVKARLIGGFALVAWPAQYGVTGIHTFIVNQNGVVYEKDVPPAPNGNSPIMRFDPDSSWSMVQ